MDEGLWNFIQRLTAWLAVYIQKWQENPCLKKNKQKYKTSGKYRRVFMKEMLFKLNYEQSLENYFNYRELNFVEN